MSERPHKLYRHFDQSGALLYVGISLSMRLIKRQHDHRSTSDWHANIVTITAQEFPDRHAALIAEALAIRDECPIHNKLPGATMIAGIKTPKIRKPRPRRTPNVKRPPSAGTVSLAQRHLDALRSTGYSPREMAWRILDAWISGGSPILGDLPTAADLKGLYFDEREVACAGV
jgi:hypothetical protein